MSRTSSSTRELAKRLLSYETTGRRRRGGEMKAAFQVGGKLHSYLGALMGSTGFPSLLSRAFALTAAEVPWLKQAHVKPDGSWEGLDELGAQVSPKQVAECAVLLVAHSLELLIAFIGETLTSRIVKEIWPKLALSEPSPEREKNEKTN